MATKFNRNAGNGVLQTSGLVRAAIIVGAVVLAFANLSIVGFMGF